MKSKKDQERQKRILAAGTTAHYEDALYYDQAYRRRRHDVRYYAALAGKARTPVLELGCGTGRVTLAMAEAGAEVVGVDAMQPMLARAKERLAKSKRAVRERVRFVKGDLRTMRLRERFSLVVAPFNVLNHLYARKDFERAFATVRAHLAPKGRFVFDVIMPYPPNLARDPSRFYRAADVKLASDGKRYAYGESFQYDPATQVQLVTMAFRDRADETNLFVMPLAHREIFPEELSMLLHYNGFDVVSRDGGFEGEALTMASESQVVVARARKGFV